MGKYESLTKAINLIEAIDRLMNGNGVHVGKMREIIADLQSIAKDVRYGGKWEGDFEIIAKSLESCARSECCTCGYNKIETGCSPFLKRDAAAAIRQMGKDLKELKAARAEERTAEERTAEERKPAAWQLEAMKIGGEAPDELPFDDDESMEEE